MKNPDNKGSYRQIDVWKHGFVFLFVWTLIVVSSIVWNFNVKEKEIENSARIQAESAWEKDIVYRRWNASHGGVYVPVSEYVEPNPYLDVPFRDYEDPNGRMMTLINPAFMNRQVNELALEAFNIHEHVTSLKPLRPQNEPDFWEVKALGEFETGVTEVSSIEIVNDERRLRFMRPLVTEEGCLNCHAKQGYKVGDIRGGISISVPVTPFEENAKNATNAMLAGHSILWFFGLIGIFFSSDRLNKQVKERAELYEERENIISELKDALENIKTLRGLVPICASCKKIRDDKGYWNQMETYVKDHTEASFSHGVCPDCMKELYPDYCQPKQDKEEEDS